MVNESRVWVIQEGKNDYASSEDYGVVEFVTRGDLRKMDGQQNQQVMADIRRFLSLYVQGKDYIVPAGNPMLVALVCMSLGGGNHKFLKWDGVRKMYIPYTLNQNMVK